MWLAADALTRDCSSAGDSGANTANTLPLRARKCGDPCDSNSSTSGNARHSSRTCVGMSAIAKRELLRVVALAEVEDHHRPEIDHLRRRCEVDGHAALVLAH